MGAFKTLSRNPFIALVSVVYFLLHLALNGLQVRGCMQWHSARPTFERNDP